MTVLKLTAVTDSMRMCRETARRARQLADAERLRANGLADQLTKLQKITASMTTTDKKGRTMNMKDKFPDLYC